MAALGVNGSEDVAHEWDAIGWRAHEDNVRRLRQRIFKAVQDRDLATARNLQKLILRSWSNTLLSVRQATQRNTGRMTAGIDGGSRWPLRPGWSWRCGCTPSPAPGSPARSSGCTYRRRAIVRSCARSGFRDRGPLSPGQGP
ncbi:hypothetical protein Vau01_114210 [Virgisporangium aurantiacum]|uniref:Reverse transcriptase N-terminal domain-containing protein n=2 Tax=Virgisporangium aurantiacum TaxID=175570 RepID=A0A8J3ZM32_9ACTN|nr:hypothetical protein Vau01_114210 [Virgisporangium aurantiacum]